ncbi:MAG TPA: DsrE family protein [Methylomirabilota bacterium]|nr:DsrE family protein [Methylomirabilota bacterium]
MDTVEPVLVVISTDPRSSHRAFEALRIGVGIVAGENEVTFVLADGAVHLLDDDTDALVDGDDIAKFRATLRTMDVPFHVEASAVPPSDAEWNVEHHPVVTVSRDEIAALARRARRALVF